MTSRRTVLGMLGASLIGAPLLRSPAAEATATSSESSPWSVSPSYGSGWDPSRWAPRVAAIGVTNARGFRVDSSTSQPKILAAGLTSTGILKWSPAGNYRFPLDDLPGWRDYVARTVRTFPVVRQWEVWNEPPNFTADPSPISYAKIVAAAYDTVKAIDSTIKIGLATKATNVAWLREAILGGAAGHYDYVTVHPYERAGAIADKWEEPFLAIVPQLRAMLSEADPAKAGVPVEFTEVGAPAAQHPGKEDAVSTPERQARTLVKVLTMGVAQGAQRVSWYDPIDGDYDAGEAAFGLIARDGTPRPSFAALAGLIAAVGVHPTFIGLVQPKSDTFLFVFSRRDGGAAVVGWTQGASRFGSFAGKVQATDCFTGVSRTASKVTLGINPTVIVVPASSGAAALVTTARAAQVVCNRPRTRVSWDAGTGASGLHLRGLTAPARVAGRTALQPATQSVEIAVGPDFDLHASSVLVTAVVRGFRGKAGFNLKYDADASLSSLDWNGQRRAGGWQGVASGDWQTLSWTIYDLRAAGFYGFNFRLDSDSSTYNGYQIASLSMQVLASRAMSR